MIVSLTGYMGSGKSTAGRALAQLLEWEFIDLDSYIEKKIGRSPEAIIAEDGEVRFRAIEAEALRDVVIMHQLTGENLVLALGGGTIMTTSVRRLILEDTLAVYLRTSEAELRQRRADEGRWDPQRLPVYELAALTVDTDGKTPQETAEDIRAELIENKNSINEQQREHLESSGSSRP
ncbi:MAG: AAA family ATPase [Bacteroidales bacterium]|nr:AAA family ATPase [Bacteroidales bacterium]